MNENEPIKTPVEETNQFNTYSSQGNSGNNKKGKKFWIIPIILVIVIIAVLVYYFGFYARTEQMYKRLISLGIDALAEEKEISNYKTAKGNVKLDLNFQPEIEDIDEEILDLINNVDISLGAQIDNNEKQFVVNLESDYDKKDMLNLNLYADTKNKETYLYAKDLLDKYLEIDLEDEVYSGLDELFETEESTFIQKVYVKKATEELKKEMTNIIKSEYCSSEKQVIQINGKEVNATKNTIKMTLEQFVNEYTTVLDNLKENEFFADNSELIEIIEESKEGVTEDLEGSEDSIMQINIYTTGLIQKTVKVELLILDEYEEEPLTLAFTEIEDKKYSFEILFDEERFVNSTIDLKNSGSAEVKIEIEELGELTLNMEYSEEYNTDIDKVDKNNSMNMSDMTEEDQETLLENLEKSPIYGLIEKFADEDLDYEGTENNDVSINIDNSTLLGEPVTTTLKDNQILDYSGKTLITFGIPSGYKCDRISDTFQCLEKDDNSIDVTTSYGDENEYYDLLKDNRDYLLERDYYNDVILSDKNTMTIGGRTFYYATLKCEYSYGNYVDTISTQYIWTKISDDYVVEFEISEPNAMSQADLNQLLMLTIEQN